MKAPYLRTRLRSLYHIGITLSLLLCTLACKKEKTATPPKEWQYTIAIQKDDVVSGMVRTSDKGIVVIGSSYNETTSNDDAFVVKLKEDGSEEWRKVFPNSYYSNNTLIAGPDGVGLIVEGFDREFMYIRNDASIAWKVSIDETDSDGLAAIGKLASGYIIACQAYLPNKPMVLLKVSNNGQVSTLSNFPDIKSYTYYGMITLPDGSAVIATRSDIGDLHVLKVNANGTLAWNNDHGLPGMHQPGAITAAPDGGAIITGHQYLDATLNNAFLLKLKADGSKDWLKLIDGPGNQLSYSLIAEKDGIWIGGRKTAEAAPAPVWVGKFSYSGEQLLEHTFTGTESNVNREIFLAPATSGVIVAGTAPTKKLWISRLVTP